MEVDPNTGACNGLHVSDGAEDDLQNLLKMIHEQDTDGRAELYFKNGNNSISSLESVG